MAKSEIPSIVVHSGGGSSTTGSSVMEHQSSKLSRLAKQEEFELEEEGCPSSPVTIQIQDGGGGNENIFKESDRENSSKYDFDDRTSIDGSDQPIFQSTDSLGIKPTCDHHEESTTEKLKTTSQSSHRVKLLVRSHAVHDDASPPPDLEILTTNANMLSVTNVPTLTTQSKTSSGKHRLSAQGSSQGSVESSSSGLSRDSSTETYTDSTGVDLLQFIVDTLHRNQKDRLMILKIEQELITLVKDTKRQSLKFPQMSSYNRMLVHRVAAFFGLDHYVDQSGTAVIVNKTKSTRIPDTKFQEHIRDELVADEPKKSILKRDSASFEEGREEGLGESPLNRSQEGTHSSSRHSSQEDLRWSSEPRPWSSTDSDSSGRPQQAMKSSSSVETESLTQNVNKSSKNIALLTKGESETKELLLLLPSVSQGARPAVTKASSFGGISVLSREGSSPGGKGSVPRLTKAESFNVTTISSSHLSPTSTTGPLPSTHVTPSSTPSPSPTHISAPSAHGPAPSLYSSDADSTSLSFVAGQPQQQFHVPVQVSSQVHSGWQSGNRDSLVAADGTSSVGRQVVWPLSGVDSLPPGSVIINPQSGTPYLNVDGSVYRQKPVANATNQAIMLAPFQPVAPSSAQVPVASHLTAGSALSQPQSQQLPHQQSSPQLHLQQQQQQQQPPSLQAAPTVVYIPYVPSQIQTSPQPTVAQIPQQQLQQQQHLQQQQLQQQQQQQQLQQQQLQQQQQHLMADQRSFSMDSNSANIADLLAQMSSLNFVPAQLSAQQSQDSGSVSASRGVIGMESSATSVSTSPVTPQGYIVPAFKTQNFMPQQGNVNQLPLYYMQQVSQNSSVSPVRYIYPTTPSAQASTQQPAQGPGGSVSLNNQNIADMQCHMSAQTGSQQILGTQYLPGYQVLSYTQSGDTATVSAPYVTYSLASHNASVTCTSSVLVPSSGISLPVYPYTNMVLTTVSNGAQILSPPATSHPVRPTGFVPPVPVHNPSAALPMYIVATTSTPTTATQMQVVSNVSTPYASYRPTLPAPNATSQVSNQQLNIGSPFVGYTVYNPSLQATPSQQPQTPTAFTPASHTPSPSTQFTPAFMTTFQVLRPGIPVVSNIKNSTPPPQNVIPSQFPSPPQPPSLSSTAKIALGFPVAKSGDPSPGECFGVGSGGSRQDPLKNTRLAPLQIATSSLNAPPSGLVCRRGIPVMQDIYLIGHPLQHHLNPLLLPQQRPLVRFPHPSSGPGSSVPNRPPKMRKQRSKSSSSSSSTKNSSTSNQPSSDFSGNHILEVEGLPEGMKKIEVERYLEMVTNLGAKIQFICTDDSVGNEAGSDFVVSARYIVLAIFESETAAQSALLSIKTPKFQLRQLRQGRKDDSLKNLI